MDTDVHSKRNGRYLKIKTVSRCEKHWPAHSSLVFACDWHPEQRNWLATGGRDKTIKVWDTSKGGPRHEPEHTIYTIGIKQI